MKRHGYTKFPTEVITGEWSREEEKDIFILTLYTFVMFRFLMSSMYNFWKFFQTEKRKKGREGGRKEEIYHLSNFGHIFNLSIWASISSFIKWEYQELHCLFVPSTSIYWVYCLSCCELAIMLWGIEWNDSDDVSGTEETLNRCHHFPSIFLYKSRISLRTWGELKQSKL